MNTKDVLIKAVCCDTEKRYFEAQDKYEEGIASLLRMIEDSNSEEDKRRFLKRAQEYIQRAEALKNIFKKSVVNSTIVANIQICDDSIGHSYNSLFAKYIDKNLIEIIIEEPWLYEKFHFHNMIQFLELIVEKGSLKYIRIVTKMPIEKEANQRQTNFFNDLKKEFLKQGITLCIKYEDKLHDRKIILSNGYIFKMGKGLNIYKANNPYFWLGLHDLNFRKCHQTEIDIIMTKNAEE